MRLFHFYSGENLKVSPLPNGDDAATLAPDVRGAHRSDDDDGASVGAFCHST